MKVYDQLAEISGITFNDAEKAFFKWIKEVGYSEKQGAEELFSLPAELAVAILKTHIKN